MQASALRTGRVFDVRRSAGIGGKVVAACQVSHRLDAELGIVNGETKHFLDGGYYVYLSVSVIDEDRFHYDVPYPTFKSFSLEKEADSDGDISTAVEFEVELVRQDGKFISIPINRAMTADDMKWEISKRTRKKLDTLKLSAGGAPLPDGPLHSMHLGGPIQVLERLTGGAGKTTTARELKKMISRSTGIRSEDLRLLQDGLPVSDGPLEETQLRRMVVLVAESEGVGVKHEAVVSLQGGRKLRVQLDGTATTKEVRTEISKVTGLSAEDLRLLQDGRPVPDGPIDQEQLRHIVVMVAQTGGGGGKPTSSKSKQSARRAARYRDNKRRTTLSHGDTLELMERRSNKNEEVLEQEVDELVKEKDNSAVAARATIQEAAFSREIAKRKVPIYGTLDPRQKPEETVRVMSLNINGLNMSKSANPKADRLRQLIPKYKIDVLGMQETCVNWSEFKPSNTVASLLRSRDVPIRSTHSYNKHESDNIGLVQRGGTVTLTNDSVSTYVKDSGSDHTMLGRWSWYLLEGEPGHKTRVVTAYAPCGSESSGLSTNWKQQKRFIQNNAIRTRDPRQMFEDDLCQALAQWRAQGDRLILMMDANSNVHSGKFARRLAGDDIEMKEGVHEAREGQGPNTHFRGSEPIDGIWFTKDLELQGASYLPFDGSLGDHRPVLADFSQQSVLGINLPRIVMAKARRLNSKVPRIRDEYVKNLEEAFQKGSILERLQKVQQDASFPASAEVSEALERIDREMENMMLASEKSCRKMYACHYEFSPTVQFWINRCQAYRELIKLRGKMDELNTRDRRHSGLRRRNVANVYRRAERAGIQRAPSLSRQDLLLQYGACRTQTKSLLAESPWLRKQFLSSKLDDAMRQHNDVEAKRVKQTLKSEQQRKTWGAIQRVTKPERAGAITHVDVKMQDGSTLRCDNKESMEDAVAKEIMPRFKRADNAPICQGALFELLGYSANTETAIEILEGRFTPPDDTDGPTLLLFEEIARIWALMEAGEVDIVVTKDDYQHFWKRMKEKTSSSYSKLHIGHYKAAAHSDVLAEIHALKLSLISQTGSAPERWARGLSVMLEKIAGIALVTKLRAIILMEADFNYHNKLIFGKRMMELARQHNLIPEEIYSEKGKTAEDAILHQVLAYDIARQKRAPYIVASVDASQCYDRISHAMAALTLRASKVPPSSVNCMLKPIREMEFYIRTAFGESSDGVGGADVVKQGGGQGNGAAPPTWQQISAIMLGAHRRAGHGITVTSPISRKTCTKAGILYVDDTNLWAGLTQDDDLPEAAAKAQEGITSWGDLLMATGGALNPTKCFWTIHDMAPRPDGTWEYRICRPALETIKEGEEMAGTDMEEREDDRDDELDQIKLTIPQLDGDVAAIAQLQASQATENLGLLAPPNGSPTPQFDKMKERVDRWTKRIKDGHLPARSNWLSYQCQLWPGLKYGLGASPATIKQLEGCLRTRDHKLLSSLGICRNIPTDLRYIPSYFGGFALNDLTIEATAEALNMFLQHYETSSTLGTFLTASIENLQLELGVSGCPFSYEFDVWESLATDSWVKSLWERIQHFGLDLQLDYKVLPMPRVNDECIMESCVETGIRGSALIGINRVRKHQEALFLSDIVTADGRKIDPSYVGDWTSTQEYQLGKHRSQFEFGRECPTPADWEAWSRYWNEQCNNSQFHILPSFLGGWRAPSPRIWRAFYDEDEDMLEVLSDDRGVLYFIKENRRYVERASDKAAIPRGIPATVEWLTDGRAKLKHYTGQQVVESEPKGKSSFLEHLKSFGGTWMWKDLRMEADPSWVAESLKNGTLVCVTDGSFNRSVDPDICSAGWIIQCRETEKRIVGTVLERSESAGSYRGELVGMLAIKLFLLAIEEYYQVVSSDNEICCDNKGALFTFGKTSKRVPKGRSNSDIHRVIRTINGRIQSKYLLTHVKAHQDDHSLLSRLSLEARLNCLCDELAKTALQSYWNELATGETTHVAAEPSLPLEVARLYVEGIKQTTDVAKGLSFSIGKKNARTYLANKSSNSIPASTFDHIDFPALKAALKDKPRMYNTWYAKQVSGWCATGAKLAQWDPDADSRCPNCNTLQEDAGHLMQCHNAGRTALLRKSTQELGEWMSKHGTHPILAQLVTLFLDGRGRSKLSSATNLPEGFRPLCREQDLIGWRNFTEGRISSQFRIIQGQYLRDNHPQRSIETWLSGFVSQLLAMTHAQWIYRCITKHHRTKGTKALAKREEVVKEVNRQRLLGEEAMADEDRWMLEVDLDQSSMEDQQYWLHAVEAARQAGAHALEASNGATTAWADIVRDKGYAHIASSNPPPQEVHERKKQQSDRTLTLNSEQPIHKRNPRPPRASEKRTVGQKPAVRRPLPQQTHRVGDNRTRRSNFCTEEARTKDDCKLLQQFSSRPRLESRQLGQAFRRPPILVSTPSTVPGRTTTVEEVDAYKYCSHSMTQTDFKRFNNGKWLADSNINMLLQAYVTDKIDRAHCFTSHFFTQLLNVGYEAVSNYSNAFGGMTEEGAYTLDNLFIPAHVDGNHWIILRVNFTAQCIELHDSMGTVNPRYNSHLEGLRRYLYRELHKNIPEQNWPGYASWSQSWPTRNLSRWSPKQLNGYDCGVFAVLSTYIMARGVQLSRDTYDQSYMDAAKLRSNLALAVLAINELRIDGQSRLNFQATSTATNPSRKRKRDRKCSTAGGKRIRSETRGDNDSDRVQTTSLLNRKRNAKSLAEPDQSQRSMREVLLDGKERKRPKKNVPAQDE